MRSFALLLGVVVFTLDLLTKWWVKSNFWLHDYAIVEGFFTVQYVQNEGIAFGLLHDLNSDWKPLILSTLALAALAVVGYYILHTPSHHRVSLVSMGLLLGGILGNSVDRLLHHHVVDFLRLHWNDLFSWPTFNIADMAITTGVFLIVYDTFFGAAARRATLVSLLCLSLGHFGAAAQKSTSPQVISSVVAELQAQYRQMESFSARFEQIFRARTGELRESGIVLMKKPGRMYWEYRQPTRKYFVADGNRTYFYVPRDRQVLISELDVESARSPLLFLLGKGDIAKDFQVEEESSEQPLRKEHLLLRLTPHRPQPEFSYLLLEIDPSSHLIFRLVVQEPIGQRNDYILSEMKENVKIPDRQFKLDIPSDVEIIRQ